MRRGVRGGSRLDATVLTCPPEQDAERTKEREAKRKERGQSELDQDFQEKEYHKQYGQWVPGGDAALRVEAAIDAYLRGYITYQEAIVKADTGRREFLATLQRMKGTHDSAKR